VSRRFHPLWTVLHQTKRIHRFERSSDAFYTFQGPKWRIVWDVLNRLRHVEDYEYIWFPDDDLDISCDAINRMFTIAKKYKWVVLTFGFPIGSVAPHFRIGAGCDWLNLLKPTLT
jgi:hypothetical protein